MFDIFRYNKSVKAEELKGKFAIKSLYKKKQSSLDGRTLPSIFLYKQNAPILPGTQATLRSI